MKNLFKNPHLNGVFAELYIVILALTIHFLSAPNTPDTLLGTITVLSLFVLSAAIMGYLFLGEPLQLYLSGQKTQAVSFFIRTVLSFALITLFAVVSLKLMR